MFTLTQPLTIDSINSYAHHLFANLANSKLLTFRSVEISGWQPEKRKCHNNVETFLGSHTNYRKIYGWIVVDSPDSNFCIFLSHSVVADESGNIFEITPIESLDPRPFIQSNLPEEDFETLVLWLSDNLNTLNLTHNKNGT